MTSAVAAVMRLRAEPEVRRSAVVGWVLYDLANTIFSLNIVSLYFSLWIVRDLGGRDADYGLANGVAQGLMLVSAPILGALSDQAKRRIPFLVVSTVICCALTATLGVRDIVTALVLFGAAYYVYQAGLIFYDALLPTVSTEQTRGTIGGIGVGVGYLGSFIGLGMGLLVLRGNPEGKPLVFQLTALLFLLFSIPCFLFVRERVRTDAPPFGLESIRRAFGALRRTAARARQYPGLARFLTGRVFYADAANTLIVFMGIYATQEMGFDETGVQLVLGVGIATAVVGGLVWGRIVDAIGPKHALDRVLFLWMTTFALAAAVPYLGMPNVLFWPIAALAGFALAGTWSADRPYMLRLTPPRLLGQFYGFYAMVGRFAAMIGPLLWGLIVDGLGWGRPAAVLSLLVMVVIAYAILPGVSDARREWTAEELPA